MEITITGHCGSDPAANYRLGWDMAMMLYEKLKGKEGNEKDDILCGADVAERVSGLRPGAVSSGGAGEAPGGRVARRTLRRQLCRLGGLSDD